LINQNPFVNQFGLSLKRPTRSTFFGCMTSSRSRYILIALLLGLFLNYPLLSAANKPIIVFGVPLLYLYLGIIWMLAVVLLYLNSKHSNPKKTDE